MSEKFIKTKEYVLRFMSERDYPLDSVKHMDAFFGEMAQKKAEDDFLAIVHYYDEVKTNIQFPPFVEKVRPFCERYGLSYYSVNLAILLSMTKLLKQIYLEYGLSLEMYEESLKDIYYKILECHLVKGEWGNFVPNWELGFFRLQLFSFGLVQFEIVPFEYDTPKAKDLKGKKIINVHMPRTGKHLERDEVLKAMGRALEFFKGQYDIPAFVCASWLMHPLNRELLSPSSHIVQFMDLFELVLTWEDDSYEELWRLFDMDIDENHLEKLPTNTSFRRNYVEAMRQKRKSGHGVGVRYYEAK